MDKMDGKDSKEDVFVWGSAYDKVEREALVKLTEMKPSLDPMLTKVSSFGTEQGALGMQSGLH